MIFVKAHALPVSQRANEVLKLVQRMIHRVFHDVLAALCLLLNVVSSSQYVAYLGTIIASVASSQLSKMQVDDGRQVIILYIGTVIPPMRLFFYNYSYSLAE